VCSISTVNVWIRRRKAKLTQRTVRWVVSFGLLPPAAELEMSDGSDFFIFESQEMGKVICGSSRFVPSTLGLGFCFPLVSWTSLFGSLISSLCCFSLWELFKFLVLLLLFNGLAH
jgi:hypothetical protein